MYKICSSPQLYFQFQFSSFRFQFFIGPGPNFLFSIFLKVLKFYCFDFDFIRFIY